MISMERELLQTITTPFSCDKPENSIFGHFWPFLAIFHHLCQLVGHPLTPSPLLLTKMLSLGAVAMISTEKELLQAVTTAFPTNDLTSKITINA